MFSFSKPYFSLSWKLDQAEVESTISNWLEQYPDVEIATIKHDAVASFWFPTQFFVSIYYK
jgi:hypothetical protein